MTRASKARAKATMEAFSGAVNPWIDGHVPDGYTLRRTDENGLMLHWSAWKLESAP